MGKKLPPPSKLLIAMQAPTEPQVSSLKGGTGGSGWWILMDEIPRPTSWDVCIKPGK